MYVVFFKFFNSGLRMRKTIELFLCFNILCFNITEQEINIESLKLLTNEVLIEIGLKIGPRLRLLKEIKLWQNSLLESDLSSTYTVMSELFYNFVLHYDIFLNVNSF